MKSEKKLRRLIGLARVAVPFHFFQPITDHANAEVKQWFWPNVELKGSEGTVY